MINLVPLPPPQEAQSLWIALSQQSRHSFFLSWYWIGTWLHCIAPSVRPMLLTVSAGGSPIAAAIMGKTTVWRRRLLPVRTWTLNTTGLSEFDCLGMEYNGLLAAQGREKEAWAETLTYFKQNSSDWDEIALNGVPIDMLSSWSSQELPIRELRCDPSRYLDLSLVRDTADDSCLSLISPRVRTRVRHTLSGVQKRCGPLSVRVAGNSTEALNFLAEMIALHNERWRRHPSGGAFFHSFAETFHKSLIGRHFDDGLIQLVKVSAGSATLGVLYNFVYQGRVYFHQSGMNYPLALKNESLGLLVHSLAIDLCAADGHDVYDMLAGDSQYKRSLTQAHENMWWGSLQIPRAKLSAERFVLDHYRTMRRWLKRTGGRIS